MQNPVAIANYLIEKSNFKITPLQVVKLVYIAHGYTLALTGNPLFDEKVGAWKFGPVVPSVYHSFKHFGRGFIQEKSTEIDFDSNNIMELKNIDLDQDQSEYRNQKAILDKIWELYKDYDGFALIDITHKKNTPWEEAYKVGHYNTIIQNEKIESYYKKFIQQ